MNYLSSKVFCQDHVISEPEPDQVCPIVNLDFSLHYFRISRAAVYIKKNTLHIKTTGESADGQRLLSCVACRLPTAICPCDDASLQVVVATAQHPHIISLQAPTEQPLATSAYINNPVISPGRTLIQPTYVAWIAHLV